MNSNITISDLLKMSSSNIIDIRDKFQYLNGHILDAQNIDFYELFFHPEKYLIKDQVYYIYCNSGSKSKRVVEQLNKVGYHTVNIIGGYKNYLFQK